MTKEKLDLDHTGFAHSDIYPFNYNSQNSHEVSCAVGKIEDIDL